MLEFKKKYAVKTMCRALGINESGYYRWLRNKDKMTSRQFLSVEIEKILNEHPDNANYGVDRMQIALSQNGIDVSRSTVRRAMRESGLLHKRRVPRGITKATTEIQDRENLIKRDFRAEQHGHKFLTDITEIQCFDGKLYVSPVMECSTGEIVAMEIRDNMKKELCISMVEQMRKSGVIGANAILHSDRGSQYTSEAFRDELKRAGLTQSLSGTGHCFDNARMESFFATLKKEKIYQVATYKLTREEVKSIIFRYVFVYYNRIRIYTANPMGLPPAKYREWARQQMNQVA